MLLDRYHWILNDKHEPVRCTMHEWAVFFEDAKKRVVERTRIDDIEISTVFLGINHRFSGDGPPLLFETMVFGPEQKCIDEGGFWGEVGRWSTWDEAKREHKRVVWKYRGGAPEVVDNAG